MEPCAGVSANVGTFYGLNNSGLGLPIGIILLKKGYSMTAAEFKSISDHIVGVKAKREFPIKIKSFEDSSTEPTYFDYSDESREVQRQGKYRFAVTVMVNPCLRKELMKFRNFNGSVFILFDTNVILGTSSDSGANVTGLSVSMLNVEKMKLPVSDGSAAATVQITIDLEDEKEISLYSHQAALTWNVRSLDGLTPVTVDQFGGATSTSVVVDVFTECGDGCDTPVTGLVTADFVISGAGTLTSATESGTIDGRYTLVTVGATDSTVISLADPTLISLTSFPIICTTPATIDVT